MLLLAQQQDWRSDGRLDDLLLTVFCEEWARGGGERGGEGSINLSGRRMQEKCRHDLGLQTGLGKSEC